MLTAVFGSIAAWFPFVHALSDAWASFGVFASVAGVSAALFPDPRFWLAISVSVVGSIIPDAVAEITKRFLAPKDWHLLRERECIERTRRDRLVTRNGPLLPTHHTSELTVSFDDGDEKKGVKTSSSAHEGRSSWSSCCVESKQAMRDRRKSRNPSYLDALARARMMEEIDPDWEVTNAELDEDEEL